MSGFAAIDIEELRTLLSQPSLDFVARQQYHAASRLMQDMGKQNSNFWVALDDEFSEELETAKLAAGDESQAYRAVHVQKAAIVSELFRNFHSDRPGRYVDCAMILVRAIEYRVPAMVLQVVLHWCPMTQNYKNRVTGTTIVHLALMHQCSIEVIKVLAPSRCTALQMVDRDGLTVLHYAAMFRLPLDIVEYLYHLYPELVAYRSTNTETKEVAIEIVGVCREADEETSLQNGAVYRCPGRSTPLCVAVFQNKYTHTLQDNSTVIIFLDQVSPNVKMVPDVSGNTAFMMLLQGIYTETVMKRLLLAFCASHAEHARIIAFCNDYSKRMMLQLAIQARLSPECTKIVCEFIIMQFERLNSTIHGMWVHGRSNDQEKLGVKIAPGDACFDVDGVLTSVGGSQIRVQVPVASASQVVHDFTSSNQKLMDRAEAKLWCVHMSAWVNPLHRENHNSETEVLSNLIEFIGPWFRGLQWIASESESYKPTYTQIITYLQTAIQTYHHEKKQRQEAVLATQQQKAQSNGDALLAELEAEKAMEAAKADKSATKSAKNARRRQRTQQQHSAQQSMQQLEAQQREEAHWAQKHTGANARSTDANAAEAGMDIPADPVRQPSHAKLEQARKHTYEQQLLQQLEWERTEQARLAHNIHASPVACGGKNEDNDDDAFSDAFENAMRMCLPQLLPELSEADKVMRDSGWLLNHDRSRRFSEAVKSYKDEMGQELKTAMQHYVDDENSNECILCSAREIDTVFMPCMHRCYCSVCIDSGEFFVFSPENKIKCPLCPAIVDEIILLQ